MTKTSRGHLLSVASLLVAVAVANVLGVPSGLASFRDARSAAIGVLACVVLAAVFGATWARLEHVDTTRSSTIAAFAAGLAAFLLVRFPSPWIDLGPFGAGPLTHVALVVIPVAQLAAIAAVRRWSAA